MTNLFAGIHIADKSNEFLPLNINFEKNILYLKETISKKIDFDAQSIEVVYNGGILDDNIPLSTINPNSVVHIFKKTKKHEPYKANVVANTHLQAQALFAMISHLQITVNSRVNILQKILAEYPEFRRNLGAQALIRDSVLFNTLQLPEVIKNVAEKYPIICEAAPFIVATIKKELTRDASTNFSEVATDSTNSSEEESSLTNQSEQARIRRITRNQLAAALHQAGSSSVNSLSNISHRNTIADGNNTNSNLPSNSAVSSNGRITSSLFSNALARALTASNPPTSANDAVQWMDTSDAGDINQSSVETSEDGELPARYREHQYAEQLRVMAQMGFTNYQENLTFLNITSGNIENAINLIMGAHDAL